MNDTTDRRPLIIQGGMGAGISDWRLARAVSSQGQLGVVSGTALDAILTRRLQSGGPGRPHASRPRSVPLRPIADRIWNTYFVPGGKSAAKPFKPVPLHDVADPPELVELCIVANFVEVWLAREGHANPVGINYLEKIQIPHLASLYGAMLGGVDYVLMGAGIPFRVPGVLDRLAGHEAASYPLTLAGHADDATAVVSFDPRAHLPEPLPPLEAAGLPRHRLVARARGGAPQARQRLDRRLRRRRPHRRRAQRPTARQDAAERARRTRSTASATRPIWPEIRDLGLPFWLAGGYAQPHRLAEARAAGAAGVQVGTAFAFCEESGLRPDYKDDLLAQVRAGTIRVTTDPLASPTSFPFKVAPLAGTVSEAAVYEKRARVCDLGYLREAYRTESGTVGFRCPAEPVAAYVAKGGALADTVGRRCVCNALVANIGLGQTRGRSVEPGLVTAGDDLAGLGRYMPEHGTRYTAADVIARILAAA